MGRAPGGGCELLRWPGILMPLPDFLCVGAQKAGTTWLYQQLRRHPQIFLPRKELDFFCTCGDVSSYAAYFADATPGQLCGDISPNYAAQSGLAARIQQVCPNATILHLVRDPVARAFSQWKMARYIRRIPRDLRFIEAFRNDVQNMRGRGEYIRIIDEYAQFYPMGEASAVFFFDQLRAQPAALLRAVLRFLRVDASWQPPGLHEIVIPSAEHTVLPEDEAREAAAYYRPFDERLRLRLELPQLPWEESQIQIRKWVAMNQETSPPPPLASAWEMAAPVRAGHAVSLIDVMQIKHLLLQALPLDAAFEAYRDALGLGPEVQLERRRIGSLLDAASAATEFHVLHPGGERVVCEPPPVDGPGEAPRIEGVTRTVFVACFENAVAHSRSGAIEIGSELLFDIQDGELDSLPVDMAFDPLVFARDDNELGAIIDRRATSVIKVDRAWSLLGLNTVSFGHWLIEGLLQFLGGVKELGLDGVALLIDAQMPPQHREALELLGRGRFPIIVVPRWARVEADRLWRASNWFYSPHLLLTDQALDPTHWVVPMRAVADLYRFAGTILDEALAPAAHDKSVFIARPSWRHRRIVNAEEIESRLAARGFATFFPEQHPFAAQMRQVRESRNVVVQNGSAAHALLLARPGTRVCYLTHPGVPIVSLLAEMLRQVGAEFRIVSGPFVHQAQPYVDQSDYRIETERLDRVLAYWS
jgi:hypothetical protein